MARPLLLKPSRIEDGRGWFSETYSHAAAEAAGIVEIFVQDNHSLSRAVGTFRGLHFQRPPRAQAKLVRCLRGRILDFAVDIRAGSPTYGRWVSAELSAADGHQLYVPVGFAHGVLTLEPDCEVLYKVSDLYAAECDTGIRHDDPVIALALPDLPCPLTLSEKDRRLPGLAEFDTPFPFDGEPLPSELR